MENIQEKAQQAPLFSASQLRCVRNDNTLFENLNFELMAGNALQIEGANGSGKTSLLRILCGLSQPAEGEVRWRNTSIQKDRVSFYQNLAFIGHLNGIKDDLTCEENLEIVQALGNSREELSTDDVLDQMGLLEKDETPARKLSAGQRRRLALGRLLTNKARLWILDEPFTALDHTGRSMMEKIFEQHCEQGGMVIFTTHHPVTLENTTVKELRIGE